MSASALDPALRAAVDWMMRLRSGEASAQDQRDFEAWRAARVEHAQAWARLQQAIGVPGLTPILPSATASRNAQADPASTTANTDAADVRRRARDILLRPPRRVVLKSLVGGSLVLGTAGLVADRYIPLRALSADLAAGTGQRRRYVLPDGSIVTLNARSAADVVYGAQQRQLRLRFGELVAAVAPDAARPFSVLTAQGSVTALGTRFMVRQEPGNTRVTVLEHAVELRTQQGQRLRLEQGEAADFSDTAITPADISQATGAEWLDGHLIVERQPLSYVIGELQRYRRGVLRVSAAAGAIPVTGGFPLDDVAASLAGLAETLPIRVSDYGGWVTLIDVK